MSRIAALACAVVALLVAPAAARASFTVTPSSPQAGGHPDLAIHADFAQTPTSTVLHFPAGLIGNPSATAAKCAVATFESGTCPGNTQVGDASAVSRTLGVSAAGGVFNLVPHAGEPARLGIRLTPLGLPLLPILNEASVSVRPDGGLDSTISQVNDGGFGLQSLDLTLWGTHAGLSAPFIREPTSCARATMIIAAPPNAAQSAGFTPTGCNSVPFRPSAAATLQTTQRAVPSGATVTLRLTTDDSDVRRAQVVLPVGTTLSPGVAQGLEACSTAQFNGSGCPAASQIGTVSFDTPLLGTLGGKVFFGPARRGEPYKLFILVDDAQRGVRLRLVGDVTLDARTGQITTVFDDLPQVPFNAFSLTFNGGPKAVLANPPTCGTKTLAAVLTPWSGTAPKTVTASFTIDNDGRGGACRAIPFRPSLALSATSTAAGRPAGASTITVSRPDLDQDITRVTTLLPPGLAGSLTGVPTCPEANATTGACPASSRVGSVTAVVGTGSAPVTLTGTVYLTGPFAGGVAGLVIAIPSKVGPVDLGTAVVRASLSLRPTDGGVTVQTTTLPRLVGGVPVSIRRLSLRLDRPGFIVNASSCAPQQVRAVVTGSQGASATVEAPYQATDCAHLRYDPRISATAGSRGRDRKGAKPPLHTVVTIPPGQAATAATTVHLPPALAVDLLRLAHLCRPAQFAAGACPEDARVGSVSAQSPLLPVALTGPVYLAQTQANQLPGLALMLHGPVSLRLTGTVQFGGAGTSTTFAGIPDVPLSRLELSFLGGKAGPLTVLKDLCRGKAPQLTADFTGHNGTHVTRRAAMRVRGCGPSVSARIRGLPKHPRLRLKVTRARGGARLQRLTVTLPKRLRGVPKRARGGVTVKADGKRVSAVHLTARTLTIRTLKAKTISIAFDHGSVRARKGVKRRARLAFKVAVRTVEGRRFAVSEKTRGR